MNKGTEFDKETHAAYTDYIKGKGIPMPFLTEHHATKVYWGVEV
jgi:hypothetical protein